MAKDNGYTLTRRFFDFAIENSRHVRPIHVALFCWCVEKNNRVSWTDEFQLPTSEAMNAIGVKGKESFLLAIKDLDAWGAIKVLQESKNIYSARFITLKDSEPALCRTEKPHGKTECRTEKQYGIIEKCRTEKPTATRSNNKLNKQEEVLINNTSVDVIISDTLPTPKKRKKSASRAKPENVVFVLATEHWLTKIHPGWDFDGSEGKHLKSILEKFRKLLKISKPGFSDENLFNAFEHLCKELPEWYQDKRLAIINSNFNTIIDQIKSKRNGSTIAKGQSVFRT